MEEKPNYYAIIPADVRYDRGLKDKAKLLYGEITSLSNKDGYCFASNKYFANLYDVSTTTISLLIKNLIDSGYVTSELIYKEGSKEILNRYLRIVKGGYLKNLKEGIKENLKDNNINNNNTSNNINNINNNDYSKKFNTIQQNLPSDEINIFEFIESNFGRTLNPIEIEKIREWEDNELTRYAIKKSVLNGKYVINYIDRIIKNWQVEGIKTVAQAQEVKQQPIQQATKEPIWFDKEIKEQEATDIEKQEIEDILAEFR